MPRQDPSAPVRSGSLGSEEVSSVSVMLDFAKILAFTQPARTIIIGNPAIVDGTLSDESTLVLTGKAIGTTNMIVLGGAGQEIANLTVRVTANNNQVTTVHLGAVQQVFSCAGPCKPVAAADKGDK